VSLNVGAEAPKYPPSPISSFFALLRFLFLFLFLSSVHPRLGCSPMPSVPPPQKKRPFRQELETPEAAKEKAEGEKGFIAKYVPPRLTSCQPCHLSDSNAHLFVLLRSSFFVLNAQWMYIVPFVLVLLFSGGMGGQEPEAAQGGEGAAPAASGSFYRRPSPFFPLSNPLLTLVFFFFLASLLFLTAGRGAPARRGGRR